MANKNDKLTAFDQAHSAAMETVHDSFQDAYPTVASLRMQVEERTGMPGVVKRTHIFTERDFRDTVDCSNADLVEKPFKRLMNHTHRFWVHLKPICPDHKRATAWFQSNRAP
jgi:hypothetical protein